ncbi:MAG: efflux RND transporter permease subunit [Candidatus Eremiobacteraeota bacterium]|nr:efflux RND transporter permease subunit [Candidatus Eremiobacteraeota bacterium]
MSRFFLTRPIFAAVCSAILLTIGIVAIPTLPIAQFPQISPPTITISSTYPGANAAEVESAVTTPIEEAVNGAEGLRYISSVSGDDGTSVITCTFDLSRDIDRAAVDVLVAVQQASGELPNVVKTEGVTVKKVLGSFLLSVSLFSDNPKYDPTFLSNYASLQVVDPLKRIPGVGDIAIFGQRTYAMRLWLDPRKLAQNHVTSLDVENALLAQSIQVPAGSLGGEPAPPGQPYQISVNVNGQLTDPAQFEDVVVKAQPNGGYVRVRDVGRAQLGAEQYANSSTRNGALNIGLGIQQTPSANALAVSDGVQQEMSVLAHRFPPGVHWGLNFDYTDFVRESIREVIVTLAIAIVLVILVIYIFLQDWRTALIPAITIPVSLIGTFGLVKALGFSINTLTLFGLTLATGLVVDDAIVVIENIARFIQGSKDRDPEDLAAAAMKEITGAVVATSLVLLAVFVPVGFFPGVTGQLYKQFALTIACSISISLFVALTLTPALSIIFIKPEEDKPAAFFKPINRAIDATRGGYARFLAWMLPHKFWVAGLFAASLAVTAIVYVATPSSFLPDEDLGIFYITVQAPQGISLQREQAISHKIDGIAHKLPGVALVFDITGRGLGGSGNGPNIGFVVVRLKPWGERKTAEEQLPAILAKLQPQLAKIPTAKILAFNPPAVAGIGSVGGFQYELEDPSNGPLDQLTAAASDLVNRANGSGKVVHANTIISNLAPHYVIDVDRGKAEQAGINVSDLFDALQAELGSKYVNDFTYQNHTYHVYVQGDTNFRATFDDLDKIFVTSPNGATSPVTDFLTTRQETSPPIITHYDLFREIEITGQTPAGLGTKQSLDEMEDLSKGLPGTFQHEWSGISLEQIQGGGASAIIFALGLLFVFFVLAAQYESVTEPFIILLATPVALLGALVALHLRGLATDVYSQVGFVLLIGLASKNAILIVEFANQLRSEGKSALEAVTEAAEIRLRPILMTSLAFILGIVPLVVASGAGASSRHSLGTAIFGGMIVSTILNLAIIPALYLIVASFDRRHEPSKPPEPRRDVPAGAPGSVPVER